ncbi:MAG TPA: response regulator [Thermoanaerobaculia bacterium]|jgi:DNA-binding response OmpR family regulator|nr:response regulator [Thermoanaerobaculia bacterium]
MTVTPSCPAFVVHDDDAFRKSLIATLDQKHFTVTFASDGDEAVQLLAQRKFRVILINLDLTSGKGMKALEYLHNHEDNDHCGVIILGEPHADVRSYAEWADETLLKPVDPSYVADRARTYCDC